jgi:hypothetical protein
MRALRVVARHRGLNHERSLPALTRYWRAHPATGCEDTVEVGPCEKKAGGVCAMLPVGGLVYSAMTLEDTVWESQAAKGRGEKTR